MAQGFYADLVGAEPARQRRVVPRRTSNGGGFYADLAALAPPSGMDLAKRAAAGFVHGAGETLASGLEGLQDVQQGVEGFLGVESGMFGAPLGSEVLGRGVEAVRAGTEAATPEVPERAYGDSPVSEFLTADVPQAAGSMLVFAGAVAATGGSLLGAGALGALAEAASLSREVEQAGGDPAAVEQSWWIGIGLGATEALGVGRIAKRAVTRAGGTAGRAGLETLEEAGQEAFQTAGENLTIDRMTPEDRRWYEGVARAALAAGLVAGPLAGLASLPGRKQRLEVQKALNEAVAEIGPGETPPSGDQPGSFAGIPEQDFPGVEQGPTALSAVQARRRAAQSGRSVEEELRTAHGPSEPRSPQELRQAAQESRARAAESGPMLGTSHTVMAQTLEERAAAIEAGTEEDVAPEPDRDAERVLDAVLAEEPDEVVAQARLVPAAELTPLERYASDVVRYRGARPLVVDAGKPLGKPSALLGDVIVLDRNASEADTLMGLVYHELSHVARRDKFELWGLQRDQVQRIDPPGWEWALDFARRQEPDAAPAVLEDEALAYYAQHRAGPLVEAIMADSTAVERMLRENRGFIERVLDWLIEAVNRLPGVSLPSTTLAKLKRLRSEVGKTEAERAAQVAEGLVGLFDELLVELPKSLDLPSVYVPQGRAGVSEVSLTSTEPAASAPEAQAPSAAAPAVAPSVAAEPAGRPLTGKQQKRLRQKRNRLLSRAKQAREKGDAARARELESEAAKVPEPGKPAAEKRETKPQARKRMAERRRSPRGVSSMDAARDAGERLSEEDFRFARREDFLELREIADMAQIQREQDAWTKAMTTAGSKVRHKEGWVGQVVRPAEGKVEDAMVLVEHESSDLFGEGELGQRFYRALDLRPALTPPALDPGVLFARRSPAPADLRQSSWGRIVTYWQNRKRPLDQISKHLEDLGLLLEQDDAALAEELRKGKTKARIQDVWTDVVVPFRDALSALDYDQAGEHLLALHAPSRNEVLNARWKGKRPPEKRPGSGIRTSVAERTVRHNEQGPDGAKYRALSRAFDALNRARLDLEVEYGLIPEEARAALLGQWEHYAPMASDFSEEERAQFPRGLGAGVDIRGREHRAAIGRDTPAENPIPYALSGLQATVIRGEKARVGQRLYRLTQKHPEVFEGVAEIVTEFVTATYDSKTKTIRMSGDPSAFRDPLVFAVKDGGQQHYIRFKPEYAHIAEALKNMHSFQLGQYLQAVGDVTRTLAALSTRYNPVFPFVNAIRDTGGAFITAQEHGFRYAARVANPKNAHDAAKAVYRNERRLADEAAGTAKKTPRSKLSAIDQAYMDYRDAGGPIAFLDLQTIEDMQKELDRAMRNLRDGKPADQRNAVLRLGKVVGRVNDAVENAVRFNAFRYGREMFGWSNDKAAAYAKNLTTNFETKGIIGPAMNSLYMFANANVQGNARVFKAMIASPKVRTMVGGMMIFHAVWDVVNRLAGGDDEDEIPFYDKLPQWEKDHNFIVMLPGSTSDKLRYVKMPMPHVYNWFAGIGRRAGELFDAKVLGNAEASVWSSATSLLSFAADSFNPLGGGGADPLQATVEMLSPTITDPLVQHYGNRRWTGGPLLPHTYGRQKPLSETHWPDPNPAFKGVADAVNRLTGGNEVVPGRIDEVLPVNSPDLMGHYLGFFTGGLGSLLLRSMRLGGVATKDISSVRPSDVPLLRRFAGGPSPYFDSSKFSENRQKVQQAYDVLTGKVKDVAPEDAREIMVLRAKMRAAEKRLDAYREAGEEQFAEEIKSTAQAFNRAVRTKGARAALERVRGRQ